MHFFIYGASLEDNLGGPSIFHGLVSLLRANSPDCRITYLDPHRQADVTSGRRSNRSSPEAEVFYSRGLDLVGFLRRVIRRRLSGTARVSDWDLSAPVLESFLAADVVVDAWGISYCDRLSSPKRWWLESPLLMAGRLNGARTAHYTASYGPFDKGSGNRQAAKLYLGRVCDVVMCREIGSWDLLTDLGVPPGKLLLAPDTGLMLEGQPFDVGQYLGSAGAVGVSVSHQVERQWKSTESYVQSMIGLCNHINETLGVPVVLIPNELWAHCRDDQDVADEIHQRVASRARVSVFPLEKHTAQELKYLISRLQLLIVSRYHSLVAALSSCVPIVVVGWHHKYTDLLARFDQGEAYLPSQGTTLASLKDATDRAWLNRESVERTLRSRWPEVRQNVLEASCEFLEMVKR